MRLEACDTISSSSSLLLSSSELSDTKLYERTVMRLEACDTFFFVFITLKLRVE
jgi:hypothetical protein